MQKIGYLDLHTHILPKIDDGSKSEQMTKEMLQMAYQQGIRTMIATPHSYPEQKVNADYIRRQCEMVNEWGKEISAPIHVLPGNEIYYRKDICEEIRSGEVLTLADTRYILIEFSPGERFNKIYSGLKELVEQGYYPVVAHMERVGCLFNNLGNVVELISMGCYIQVNCESIMGGFFDRISKRLHHYIREGYVHFLGSDCHNTGSRPPVMEDGIAMLYKKLPKEKVDKIIYENQKRLLDGIYI